MNPQVHSWNESRQLLFGIKSRSDPGGCTPGEHPLALPVITEVHATQVVDPEMNDNERACGRTRCPAVPVCPPLDEYETAFNAKIVPLSPNQACG